MDAVLLRKMTLKSCFNEGKFAGVPISQIIQLNHTRILRWYYYNLSSIDYMQDVKDLIGINADNEIKKPGVCPELYYKVNDEKFKRMGDKTRMGQAAKYKKRASFVWYKTLDKTSKSVLQAKNHGNY